MSTEFPTGIERPIVRQDELGGGGGTTLPAQTGHAGEVLSTDGTTLEWLAVGGTGTVTSVGLSVPSIFTAAGSPVTGSGTLSFTLNNQSANLILAGPSTGAAATPTFRALASADIPSLAASKITSGVFDTARLGSGTADSTKFLRGDNTWQAFTSGTVTSVGLSLPSEFSVGGAVTSSGNLSATFAAQGANQFFGGPNGSSGTPGFRALVSADIPNLAFTKITGTVPLNQGGTGQVTANAALNALLPTQAGNSGKYLTTDGTDTSWSTAGGGSGTVTSVGLIVPSIFTVSGGAVTTSGNLEFTVASQGTGNQVFASPNGTSGVPGFRALVAADIPSLAASKITSGTFGTGFLGSGVADNTKFLRGDGTWQPFTSGTVTSIDVAVPTGFTASGGAITSSGTITISADSQTANKFYGSPFGSSGSPSFRVLDASDIPSLAASKITSGTFTTSQIPSLDTSKITTGTFANSFLDTVGIAKGGTGQTTANAGLNALLPTQTGNTGKFLTTDGTDTSWATIAGSGTVTSVSVVSANGFAGTVATATTTPAITLTTTITGLLKGNGTAISAASAGTDYLTVLSGDVTTSGNTATIPSSTITNAKLADVATATFKGRTTAGTGAPEDLTVSQAKSLLGLTGTNSGDQTITLTGGVTGSGTGSFAATVVTNANLTGDVTSVGNATTITAGVVTNAMLAGSIDLTTKVVNALPIANGGSGQTTANAALNAFLPTQTGNSGKSLQTDGTNTSWVTTGTVSSVAVSVPSILSVSGSPITSSGTIAISLASQGTGNQVFASPDGTSGTPGFRALVAADIPSLAASKITSGTIATARLGSGTADSTTFLRGDSTWQTFTTGTVTSVALSMPSIFSVSGSPITGSGGTFTVTLGSQTANYVFAAPDGSAGSPDFRALLPTDIPSLAASKITTGTFTTSQIPSLDTSKITTGTFANSFLDTVGVAKGGTGATSLTAYGIVTGGTTPTGAVQSVAAGTAGQVLTSGGSSAIPAWVTAVPVANGGTGQTTANAGLNALVPSQTGNSGKYLTTNGTDTSWGTITGGGDALTSNPLSQFASTTSAQLAGVISDETGSGSLVFATSPTLTTPTIGVATATSVNKVAVTAPTTSATLTLADGSTLATSGGHSITLTSTASTNVTLPTSGTLMTNPMTTGGDVIYGGSSGTPTRLANGSSGQVLTSSGGTSAPTWATISAGGSGASYKIELVARGTNTTDSTNTYFSFAATTNYLIYIEPGSSLNALRWNGSTLTTTALGGTNSQGIAARPGGTCMVGINTAGTNFRRTTDDGGTWANVASTTAAALTWQPAVGAENGSSTCWVMFATSGATTKIQRSTDDGASFGDISYTTSLTMRGAAANATTGTTAEWLLLASNGTTKKSTDNAGSFTSGNSLPNSETGEFLTFINGYFVALATSSPYRALYYTSAVGTSWSTCYLPAGFGVGGIQAIGISYFDSKYWLIGSDDSIWTTTDITASPCVWERKATFPISKYWSGNYRGKVANLGTTPYIVTGGAFFKFTA